MKKYISRRDLINMISNSDFKVEDINDSDISDVDINEAIQEVAKNIESAENLGEYEVDEEETVETVEE